MAAGFAMMGCPNLAAPAEVMRHVVNVESSANPYAIGVVGGKLVRQPRSLDEALATVQMLDAKGYNFSLGLAQVNRHNLTKYGITSYEQAFEPCTNLSVASQILAQCYASASGNWGKSLSCYYSGNFVTGYRDGYVQKIYESINRSMQANNAHTAAAAPIQIIKDESRTLKSSAPTDAMVSAAYRISIRSSSVDSQVTATITATADAVKAAGDLSKPTPVIANPTTNATEADVFVPQVHGPGDSPSTLAPSPDPATASSSGVDQTDLRQGEADASFVF